jgi:hypothetical protein
LLGKSGSTFYSSYFEINDNVYNVAKKLLGRCRVDCFGLCVGVGRYSYTIADKLTDEL